MRAFRAALLELQLCQLPETNWGTSALRMIPRGRAVSICNQHHCRPWIHHGVQHWPTQTNGNWSRKLQRLMAQGARSDSRSLFAAHNSASGEKIWETQVTDFHVWSVLNLGLYIQKDVSTLITDHVSFSSCYVLLLKKKTCQILWPCDKSCIPPRCHSNAHSCACFAGAWHINDQKHLCHHHYGWLVGQKLTQVPLVNI